MNWGNRLLLVFVGFAALMSYMVYRCVQSPVMLVTKEYYKDELAYQDVIEGTKKANTLSSSVRLDKKQDKIIVEFPPEMKSQSVNGSIHFYCASDEKKDRTVPINIVSGGVQEIEKNLLIPGYYTVKITWHSGEVNYYSEQPFVVL